MNGFVLDLVKAFNTISRGRMQAVFDHLNLPRADTSAWLRSLPHLVRFPTFHGKLGDPVSSSTGLPEGDSMSVVGMLGLSHVYHNFLARHAVCPTAYADNWGWLSFDTDTPPRALGALFAFLNICRLDIDLQKSWGWGSTATMSRLWQVASSAVLGRPTP